MNASPASPPVAPLPANGVHWRPPADTTGLSVVEEQGAATPVIVTEGTSETRARHEVPVLASLGLRAAAVADLFASLARLLSPVLDVLIRLWLAEGFARSQFSAWKC